MQELNSLSYCLTVSKFSRVGLPELQYDNQFLHFLPFITVFHSLSIRMIHWAVTNNILIFCLQVSSLNWNQIHLDQLQNHPLLPIIPLDFISDLFNKALQWHHRTEFESRLHSKWLCNNPTTRFLFCDPCGGQTLPAIYTHNLSTSSVGKTGVDVFQITAMITKPKRNACSLFDEF